MRRNVIVAYHADLSDSDALARTSKLRELGDAVNADVLFPQGDTLPAWPTKDHWKNRPRLSRVLDRFKRMTRGYDRVVVCGYSRGAILAHILGHMHPVDVIVSNGGFCPQWLILTHPRTLAVMQIFNQWDLRRYGKRAKWTLDHYRGVGCPVKELVVDNYKTHWSRWDPEANSMIEAFLRSKGVN